MKKAEITLKMNLISALLALSLACANALRPSAPRTREALSQTRRGWLLGAAAGALVVAPGLANAEADPSIFVGRYTDPNHPGGIRDVRLKDLDGRTPLPAGARGVRVNGGGGRGEPATYELPAIAGRCSNLVSGWQAPSPPPENCIRIDFTPKGGPRDFSGYWDGTGIKFIRDGNKWPRIASS